MDTLRRGGLNVWNSLRSKLCDYDTLLLTMAYNLFPPKGRDLGYPGMVLEISPSKSVPQDSNQFDCYPSSSAPRTEISYSDHSFCIEQNDL